MNAIANFVFWVTILIMLTWLLDKVGKEAKTIKSAPILFSSVCLASLLICIIFVWLVFKTEIGLQRETIAAYRDRLESINFVLKGGSSGPLQVLAYVSDPNSENLKPSNTNAPALAYDDSGTKPTFVWSIKYQSWK